MDVAAVTMPVTQSDAEGRPNNGGPQATDSSFLQLLAVLGLVAPILPDGGTVAAAVSDSSTASQSESSVLTDGSLLGEASAIAIAMQKMTAATQPADGRTALTQMIQAAQQQSDPALAGATASDDSPVVNLKTSVAAETPVAMPDIPVTVDPQSAEKKLHGPAAVPDPMAAQSHAGAESSKGESAAVSARLMEIATRDGAGPDRGSASVISAAATPAFNPSTQPPSNRDTTTTNASDAALMWRPASGVSDNQESSSDHHSASTEQESWKAPLSPLKAEKPDSAFSPVFSSFGMQLPPTAVRSGSAVAPVSNAVTALPDAIGLPASVRFDVHPDDLGRLRVHIAVVDHTVYTNVMTERVEAREFLVRSSERLEAGLAAQGLDIGRFQVDVQAQGREHADRGGTAWSQGETHRHLPQVFDPGVTERHPDMRQPDWEERMVSLFA